MSQTPARISQRPAPSSDKAAVSGARPEPPPSFVTGDRGEHGVEHVTLGRGRRRIGGAAVGQPEAEDRLGIPCGETTADGRVTFETVYCLGLCATAPSAMVDGKIVGRLDEAKLDKILAEAGA